MRGATMAAEWAHRNKGNRLGSINACPTRLESLAFFGWNSNLLQSTMQQLIARKPRLLCPPFSLRRMCSRHKRPYGQRSHRGRMANIKDRTLLGSIIATSKRKVPNPNLTILSTLEFAEPALWGRKGVGKGQANIWKLSSWRSTIYISLRRYFAKTSLFVFTNYSQKNYTYVLLKLFVIVF